MKPFDRRSSIRKSSVNLKLRLRPVNPSRSEDIEGFIGEIRDIGLNGVSFYCEIDLSAIKKYEIEIAFSDGWSPKIIGSILWIQSVGGMQVYGANFLSIPNETEHKLVEYIAETSTDDQLIERRDQNRRVSASPAASLILHNRKIERRAEIRLSEREGLIRRALPEGIKKFLFRRVVVTGIGVVSPLGVGKNAFLESLRQGNSKVEPLTRFDPREFSCQVGGQVNDQELLNIVSKKRARRMDLATRFGVAATLLAVKDSNLIIERINRRRVGVSMGTTMGGLGWAFAQDDIFEKNGASQMHPYTIAAASPNACSGEAASELRANGPCTTFSQGCTSAASAISYACDQVQSGRADVMFAGGCEAPFIPSIYAAFCKSGIMADAQGNPGGVPRPFSKNRSGIILAEGAAVLVLEDYEHALARGASIYAEITGRSSTCDGHQMIEPDMSGIEAARAIQIALQDSELLANDIDVIFTHAPGSKQADAVELKALRKVFREDLKNIAGANIKSMMGYAQGATTAIECAAACLAISNGFVPPSLNIDNHDIEVKLSTKIREAKINNILINCFGFGGKNVCLVLKNIG